MKVPFLDLEVHHQPLRTEFLRAIGEVIDGSAFAGGPHVERFERSFARYCGAAHAVGVGSGTEALWLALLAMEVGPGDEVITVPNSFIATAEAISCTGARPVFVDVDERSQTLDPARLKDAITSRTKVIVPVHLFGQPADMDPIVAVAQREGIRVLTDAAQAHGAKYKGRPMGNLGEAACFSFYPGKNLGAFGDAGAVVTDDQSLRDRIMMLRDHGQSSKHRHEVVGWNCRMDGIQAAVLSEKLPFLDENNDHRRAHAAYYDELLAEVEGLRLLRPSEECLHARHVYVVRVANRDRVMAALKDRGIASAIHYPVPIHLQDAYAHLAYGAGSFPVAERWAGEILSLPLFPELTTSQIEYVCEALQDILSPDLVC